MACKDYYITIDEMHDKNCTVIRIKNDPSTNHLTAPENKLFRPQINYSPVIFLIFFFSIFAFLLSILSFYFLKETRMIEFFYTESSTVLFCILYLFWFIVFFIFKLKYFLVFSIRLYQRYASSETRLKCRLIPTCSEYSIIAIEKHGAVIGSFKTIKRLKECRQDEN